MSGGTTILPAPSRHSNLTNTELFDDDTVVNRSIVMAALEQGINGSSQNVPINSILPNQEDPNHKSSVTVFLSNDGSVVPRSEMVSVSERVGKWMKDVYKSSNQIRFHLTDFIVETTNFHQFFVVSDNFRLDEMSEILSSVLIPTLGLVLSYFLFYQQDIVFCFFNGLF